ncbi:MAG: hypothetical protein B655_2219 [Methanobacterium sp. Maddingley MBC34]|nr:MAG: hypothetical protein B655_2219 [Methanobacterium sp. Maddingley MBC34]
MTPLEIFAILVLAGAVIVLLYYYLQDNRKINFDHMKGDATNLGERVYGGASNLGEKVQGGASNLGQKAAGEGTMSGMGEKINVSGVSEKVSGVGEKLNVSGVSEKVSGMGEKIKGKVSVPISTDNLSHRIDLFLNEQSDQLIEDWDLATKKDLSQLEKRFDVVSLDIESLEKRFNEYRGATNKKLETIEERLDSLENPKEEPKK